MKSYRYFLLSVLVLIFLPYFVDSYSSNSDSRLEIGGLFYTLRFQDGILETLAFATNPILLLLNAMIIIGSCLYFTFYRKRAEQAGADYSLKIAGLYFALVIITLLIVDRDGMVSYMGIDYSSLSVFGLLLAYLTIVVPVFQKLSKAKIIPIVSPNTNKYLRFLYSYSGIIFGFVILLAPIMMQFSVMIIDVNSSNLLVQFIGATYGLVWSSYPSNSNFYFFIGMRPVLPYYIIFWAPSIVLAIQMLRYLGGKTSKRLLIIGFLISLLHWVLFVPAIFRSLLYGSGLGVVSFPIPLLQLLSILILRIERSDTMSTELEIEPSEDEMVKVPIRQVILSRIRKRRNSD